MVINKVRTICPLCPYGCEAEIFWRDGFFYRIEYPEDSFQAGRLCPKGNAIPFILSHPKRCYSPNRNGRDISWEEAFFEATKIIRNYPPQNIAVAFDASLTEEEKALVWGFASSFGIESLFYFNPENIASYRIEGIKEASLLHLKESDAILVVGDLFSRFPIFAKVILDWRYEKRERRLFVFDTYPSRLFGFADASVLVPFGREVEVFRKGEKILSDFTEAKKGVLILDLTPGKYLDPFSLTLAAQQFLLMSKGEKFFLCVREKEGGFGKVSFGDLAEGIQSGKIKVLLFFGEGSSLADYSQLLGADYLIVTSSFTVDSKSFLAQPTTNFSDILLFPVPHIVEKEGNLPLFWGKGYKRGIPPFSGTKGIGEIVQRISSDLGIPTNKGEFISRRIISQRQAAEMLEGRQNVECGNRNVEKGVYLINQEEAIEYGNFFDKGDRIRISLEAAREFQFQEGERILLGDVSLRVEIREGIPKSLGLVSLANRDVKRLLVPEIERMTKEIVIRPVFKKITRH